MKALKTRHLQPSDLRGKRYRGYIRESTQAQADRGTPVARQREEIARAAEALGMVATDPVWYGRVGSGEDRDVPELRQAIADASEYDVLVMFHTSRLARDPVEAGLLKREFAAAGLILYFASQHIVSGAYASGLSEGVSSVVDAYENETKRLFVSGGMRQRQLAGKWTGNVPFGLRKTLVDRPDGTRGWDGGLEPDQETAPVVREIFDRFAAGVGPRAIALDLNSRGIRSATGRVWTSNTIDRMAANVAYTGRLIRYRQPRSWHYYDETDDQGRADLGVRFPALIDATLFDQVTQLRTERRPARGRLGSRVYPLSGRLRCRRCGHSMTGVMGARARYYRCSGRRVLGVCDAPSIRADRAEADFATWLGRYQLPADWRSEIAKLTAREARSGERDRRAVLNDRLKRLKQLYAWGDLTADEYRSQAAELKTSIGLTSLPKVPGMAAVAEALGDLSAAWAAAPPTQQAALPALMLKAAEVDDGRVVTWVVDAGLRSLLELCTVDGYASTGDNEYTVRCTGDGYVTIAA